MEKVQRASALLKRMNIAERVVLELEKMRDEFIQYIDEKRAIGFGEPLDKSNGVILDPAQVDGVYFFLNGQIETLEIFPEVADVLLHHEKIVVPASWLSPAYIKRLRKLEEMKLLQVDFFDDPNFKALESKEEYEKINEKLSRISALAKQAEIRTLFLLKNAYRYELFFREHSFYKNKCTLSDLWYSDRDQYLKWRKELPLKQIFELVKRNGDWVDKTDPYLEEIFNPIIEDIILSFEMKMPRLFPYRELPYIDILLSKLTERIYPVLQHVISELEEIRSELYESLIIKGLIASSSVDVKLPLSMAIILRELPDNVKPSDFIDHLFSLRNQTYIRKFRDWISKYQAAVLECNVVNILKAEKELLYVAQNIRSEYMTDIKSSQTKQLKLIPKILIDIADQKYASAVKETYESISQNLPYLRNRYEKGHLIYMQKLVRNGIQISNLKKEMTRCFGDKGKPIAGIFEEQIEWLQRANQLKKLVNSN